MNLIYSINQIYHCSYLYGTKYSFLFFHKNQLKIWRVKSFDFYFFFKRIFMCIFVLDNLLVLDKQILIYFNKSNDKLDMFQI